MSELIAKAGKVIQFKVEKDVVGLKLEASRRECSPEYLDAINTAAAATLCYPIQFPKNKFNLEPAQLNSGIKYSFGSAELTPEMAAATSLRQQLTEFYRNVNPSKVSQVIGNLVLFSCYITHAHRSTKFLRFFLIKNIRLNEE